MIPARDTPCHFAGDSEHRSKSTQPAIRKPDLYVAAPSSRRWQEANHFFDRCPQSAYRAARPCPRRFGRGVSRNTRVGANRVSRVPLLRVLRLSSLGPATAHTLAIPPTAALEHFFVKCMHVTSRRQYASHLLFDHGYLRVASSLVPTPKCGQAPDSASRPFAFRSETFNNRVRRPTFLK